MEPNQTDLAQMQWKPQKAALLVFSDKTAFFPKFTLEPTSENRRYRGSNKIKADRTWVNTNSVDEAVQVLKDKSKVQVKVNKDLERTEDSKFSKNQDIPQALKEKSVRVTEIQSEHSQSERRSMSHLDMDFLTHWVAHQFQ